MQDHRYSFEIDATPEELWAVFWSPKKRGQVIEHGKDRGPGPHGARQGINDYTGWFAGDVGMEGDYYGYDGPCPPWNDARVHRYTFTLYALDLPTSPVQGRFTGQDVRRAIEGHVLGTASLGGTYTLNPRLMA